MGKNGHAFAQWTLLLLKLTPTVDTNETKNTITISKPNTSISKELKSSREHIKHTSYLLLHESVCAGGVPLFIFKLLSNLQLLLWPYHCVGPSGPISLFVCVLQIIRGVKVLLCSESPDTLWSVGCSVLSRG